MMDTRHALEAVIEDGEVDTTRDPRAIADLARVIAGSLRGAGVDGIVCWVGDDESVLAHATAVELGVPVLRAVEEMGLLTLEGARHLGMRVALVATRWGGRNPVKPLLGLLENARLQPVAIAAVLVGDQSAAPELTSFVLEQR